MASAFGFVPVDGIGDGLSTGRRIMCFIPSTDATAVYLNDFVTLTTNVDPVTGCPVVTRSAAADAAVLGSVVAIDQVRGLTASTSVLGRNYRPASTGMYVYVVVARDTLYKTTVNATLTLSDIGGNVFNLVATAGDTATGVSKMAIDVSSKASSGKQFRIVEFLNDPSMVIGATTAASGSVVLVTCNLPTL